jgi:predicted ATP-dependent protease
LLFCFLLYRQPDHGQFQFDLSEQIALEGMRAITVEVQALVTMAAGEGNYGGRRTVNGIAHARLLLLMGVLQKRCSMFWSKQDVYINVVGRIRLDRGEGNAADLAIAIALASSRHSIPVRADTAFVGEVGLLGELRSVPALEKRLQEARRMGFSRVVTPCDYRSKGSRKSKGKQSTTTITQINGIMWIQCTTLASAINEGLIHPIPKRIPRQRSKSSSGDNSSSDNHYDDLRLEILDDQDDMEDFFPLS